MRKEGEGGVVSVAVKESGCSLGVAAFDVCEFVSSRFLKKKIMNCNSAKLRVFLTHFNHAYS
jgi:hypothetical protein